MGGGIIVEGALGARAEAFELSRDRKADAPMADMSLRRGFIETKRHRTVWIEAGPEDGPLMIFVHGWPEIALVWRSQIAHFAAKGWRCVAPDMRGYGGSAAPASPAA
jgi:alpha-beta hydrolase superfamily lysophospholipase